MSHIVCIVCTKYLQCNSVVILALSLCSSLFGHAVRSVLSDIFLKYSEALNILIKKLQVFKYFNTGNKGIKCVSVVLRFVETMQMNPSIREEERNILTP